MFLHEPRQRVEIACAGMRSKSPPFWRSGARSTNRRIDVRSTALSDRSQLLAIRGIERVEIFSGCGRLPRSADEESKAPAVALQPCLPPLWDLPERVRTPW